MITGKRQRRRVGDVVAIPLRGGRVGFGIVLREPLVAFFDLMAKEDQLPDIETIVRSPVLFKLWVMNHAITRGEWPIIGHVDPTPELAESPKFFVQDALDGSLTVKTTGGQETPATREEVSGLERAAVWEPQHVVDRSNDHFAGRPNKWAESLRLK